MEAIRAIRILPGTKVSHDYSGKDIELFDYADLIARGIPAIGVPCRQNKLLVVDVDVPGPQHQHDGRPWWNNFCQENGITETYTVRTPSGGFHFYFRLPESINPDLFHAPKTLSLGVDLKWNGWVGAPPTAGYEIVAGHITRISVAPPTLMAHISNIIQGRPQIGFDPTDPNAFVGQTVNIHQPFSQGQIEDLRERIAWIQTNAELSRDEWRDGLFSLKAGIEDPDLLDELAIMWTQNRAYVPGDDEAARAIVERADRHGRIGPGTIIGIVTNVIKRAKVVESDTPLTFSQIIQNSKVTVRQGNNGQAQIELSETNAAAIIGAMYDANTLYFDVRSGHYVFQGQPHSDVELVNKLMPRIQSPDFGLNLEKFRKSQISVGLDIIMSVRQVDPHRKYLESLKWDGVPRIQSFFQKYVPGDISDGEEYLRLIGRNFWVAMAARGLFPGSKFDSMLVLEGHEGINKSSMVEAIGGRYTYAPTDNDAFRDMDNLREMHQSAIVELPELLGIAGESELTIKGFLAKPYDSIRPLYSKIAKQCPRSFIVVGTTNTRRYLTKAMGTRRFWPMFVNGRINLSAIKADRDQLFAEAIECYKDGCEYWHVPEDIHRQVVERRIFRDPLTEVLSTTLSASGREVTTFDAFKLAEASGAVSRGLTSTVAKRIENALMSLGYEVKYDAKGDKVWYPKVSDMPGDSTMSVDAFI